jgi:hypothetical protein
VPTVAFDADALPLVAIAHNWVAAVEVTRTWPTTVQTAADGTEQRAALALQPRETVRYQLTAAGVEACTALLGALLAAGTPGVADPGDVDAVRRARRVRVPRWEDGLQLLGHAVAGDTSLLVEGGAADRAFADGGGVAVWRDGAIVRVVALAAADAVGADGDASLLQLAAPLAGDGVPWLAGSVVAPIATAWVAPDEIARLGAGLADGALTFTRDVRLAGERAGAADPTDGGADTPVVAAVVVRDPIGIGPLLGPGMQCVLVAECVDAAGVRVPAPVGLVWTSTNADLPVRALDRAGHRAAVEVRAAGAGPATLTATEPVSGLAASVVRTGIG